MPNNDINVCCFFCKKTLPARKLYMHYLNAHVRPKTIKNLRLLPATVREIKAEIIELDSYLKTKDGRLDNHAKRRLLILKNEVVRRMSNSSFVRIVQGGSPGLKR